MQSAVLFDSSSNGITQKAGETLAHLITLVGAASTARLVWERLLSEQEKQQLGGDLESVFWRDGTLGMWQAVRAGSLESAVIEIAESVDLISANRAAWLRREAGIIHSGKADASPKPEWDPARGELWLGGKIIRRARITKKPTNIRLILNAFQTQGWPTNIKNPLTRGVEQLHETLRSLNDKLSGLKFHAAGGGQEVFWVLSVS